jgi:hypothetical protein
MALGRLAGIAVLLTVLTLLGTRLSAAPKPEKLAQRAAESWLKNLDAGKYEQSWAQSAKVFKVIVAKAKWEESMAGIRKPLGKLISRKVQSREYSEKLPGSPDGKYVVIKFDAVFEHKADSVETVTSMLDSDGAWRVSGYYVL